MTLHIACPTSLYSHLDAALAGLSLEQHGPSFHYRITEHAGGFWIESEGHRVSNLDLTEVLRALQHDLAAWAAGVGGCQVFHAAALQLGTGAVVLPGVSGAGKSSLSAALLGEGAALFSDEFTVLDTEGKTHPFAFPLRMRRRATTLHPHLLDVVTPLSINANRDGDLAQWVAVAPQQVAKEAVPVHGVVFPVFDAAFVEDDTTKKTQVEWTRLSGGEAVLHLLNHRIGEEEANEVAFDFARSLLASTRAWTLRYADPLLAANEIRSRVWEPPC